MKKLLSKAFAIAVSSAMLVSCTQGAEQKTAGQPAKEEKKLTAVATMYPVYEFTSKIGGDKVNVINLIPAGAEAHGFELSPDDMVKIEKADLLVYNGAGMESWIDDVKNSVSNKELTFVDSSSGIQLLENMEHDHEEEEEEHEHHDGQEAHEEDTHDHEHHHHHGKYDPHIWLGLKEAKIQVENIKNALIEKDPENREYYENNCKDYILQLNELDSIYKEKLAPFKGNTLVVAHEAFGYLFKNYGLNQMGIEGVFEDSEPDPATMKGIIQFINDKKIRTIYNETLSSSKVVDAIAKETGVTIATLDPIEGLTKDAEKAGKDYLSIMMENLDTIVTCLQNEQEL